MWQYNSFYDDPNNILCHSHKYIDRYEKNGKYVYIYDKPATQKTRAQIQDEVRRNKRRKIGEENISNPRMKGYVADAAAWDVERTKRDFKEADASKNRINSLTDNDEHLEKSEINKEFGEKWYNDLVKSYKKFKESKNGKDREKAYDEFINIMDKSYEGSEVERKALLSSFSPKQRELLLEMVRDIRLY